MPARIPVCPFCKEPLDGTKCNNVCCDLTDISELIGRSREDSPEAILKGLAGTGKVYYDTATKTVVLRGYEGQASTYFQTTGGLLPSVVALARFVQQELSYSPSQYSKQKASDLLLHVNQGGPGPLPQVAYTGDYPMMFESEDKKALLFPNICTPLSRFIGDYLYTGRAVTPKNHNGLFERWLASFRCATEADRDVLRCWCVGAMMQSIVPPGGVPGLLIAAHDNGSGKTASANMLGSIFGGCMTVFWSKRTDETSFVRTIMGASRRIALIDNLSTEGKEQVIEASNLASIMTESQLTTKKLYSSTGAVEVENRFLYILTANAPMLSPELFSRVAILSLEKSVTSSMNWIETWTAQRWEILEDLMWYCETQWPKGDVIGIDVSCRFNDWNRIVARVTQRAPVYRSKDPAIESLYVGATLRVFRSMHYTEPILLSRLVYLMESMRMGPMKQALRQQRITTELLKAELSTSDKFVLEDKEGDTWVTAVETTN